MPLLSATLDFLARFLSKVADQQKINRMNAKGLAVVLSPNVLRNPEGDPHVFKVRMYCSTKVLRCWMCPVTHYITQVSKTAVVALGRFSTTCVLQGERIERIASGRNEEGYYSWL